MGTNPTVKKDGELEGSKEKELDGSKEKDPEGTQERNKKMKDSSHGNSEPGN